MKNFCMLVIFCVALLTPAMASASIASATGTAYVSAHFSGQFNVTDTTGGTIADTHDVVGSDIDVLNKPFGNPDPFHLNSSASLEFNPLSPNPVKVFSTAAANILYPLSGIGVFASNMNDATINQEHFFGPVSAFGTSHSELKFKRLDISGPLTFTVDYGYSLNLLNAKDGRPPLPDPPLYKARGDVIINVGLLNSAGTNLLSLKDGWTMDGGTLMRHYGTDAGGYLSSGDTLTSTWQVNLGTFDTYTLVVFTNAMTTTAAPEPTTICLLGLGVLGLLKKRRA